MEELLAASKTTLKTFTKLQKVDAKLLVINKNSATFDVGGKAEGVLEGETFSEAKNFLKTLKVGDSVRALVLEPETRE